MGLLFREAPHHIVILRALQLGDLLCTVPTFRSLRGAFPQARISLIGLPWAEGFVRRFSHYLDEFIPFPGWPGLPESKPQLRRIPCFIEEMQERRFDLALQMQGAGTITNPLVCLFHARQMAGFCLPGQFRPNQASFPYYPEGEHEIHVFLKLMEALGIPSQGDEMEFPIRPEEQQAFETFRAKYSLEPGRYICLHPGARAARRRWTAEKFARVGDALASQGFQVVLTGTSSENELTQAVAEAMHSPAVNAAGQTDLGTLAMLLTHTRLLISNDTGVSHVAAALGTPSVVLFTVSEPGRWRPLDPELHRVITQADQVEPDAVLAEAEILLREARTNANEPH